MSKAPKIAKAVGRSVKEWSGKNADSMPPKHVRLRIFDRAAGVCFLSGRKIRPGDKWHCHHIVAICEGGLNVESNLAPALIDPHKVETKRQRKVKQKIDRSREKHIGIKDAPARPIVSRGFAPTAKREKPQLDRLPIPAARGVSGCFKIGDV